MAKVPKAKKLPSGNWRVQIQVDGERYSVTKKTRDEAEYAAKLIFAGIEAEKKSKLTVGKAIDRYILSVEKTLSPSTIIGHQNIRNNHLQSIMGANLTELKNEDIQIAIGEEEMIL